jgi:hypothetical protein
MMSPSNRHRPAWTASLTCAPTPGCGATPEGKSTVATVAQTEPLQPVPAAPYPLIVAEQRTASRQALVAYRGNRYSVPPELAAARVVVTRPVGGQFIDIATATGIVVARHKLLADGLGGTVRDSGHVIALDAAAMAAANTGRSQRRKQRIPPEPQARAAADALRQRLTNSGPAPTRSPTAPTTPPLSTCPPTSGPRAPVHICMVGVRSTSRSTLRCTIGWSSTTSTRTTPGCSMRAADCASEPVWPRW